MIAPLPHPSRHKIYYSNAIWTYFWYLLTVSNYLLLFFCFPSNFEHNISVILIAILFLCCERQSRVETKAKKLSRKAGRETDLQSSSATQQWRQSYCFSPSLFLMSLLLAWPLQLSKEEAL